ncbi:MAG: hypothetical protein V3V16_12895 [Melioribacteraceae bacterium]
MAVITAFISWNNTTIWIPISAILIILSLLIFIIRSTFNSIDERLKKLEEKEQYKK